MPKVSVIIPVYNVEKYLGECLDSVLGQTLRDIEIICVDDGSTDSSPRILAAYAAKDPRVKVLRQKNAGPGPARNRALDAASGEAVVFMDPDDKYPDDRTLECLGSVLEGSGCAIAGGMPLYFPEDFPGVKELNIASTTKAAFPHLGVVDFRDFQVPYRYWCYMFTRDLLKDIRFPALRTFQDVPFFARAMAEAGRFAAIDRITYAYRKHEGNGTRDLSPEKQKDRLVGIRLVMDIACRYGLWRMFDNMRGRMWRDCQEFGMGRRRLLAALGLKNEIIYRFRRMAGLVRGAS